MKSVTRNNGSDRRMTRKKLVFNNPVTEPVVSTSPISVQDRNEYNNALKVNTTAVVLTTSIMKRNKVFIVSENVTVADNPNIDGLEIIIYNDSLVTINVYTDMLITTVSTKQATRIMYSVALERWIII
jgi:hypothetical protein